eukprot:jgi/Chrzof1/11786/Cz06g10030.t1
MHINSMVVANLVLQSCSVPRLVLSYARAVCIASHISPTTTSVEVDRIHLHKKQKVVEVCFKDGQVHRFSAELLRVMSPSADNRSATASGNIKVPSGRRQVGILGLEPVGHYAVRILFDDLHQSGIYTWEYLHDLSQHRYTRAKEYIRLLRQQGLSRDPRQQRSTKAVPQCKA